MKRKFFLAAVCLLPNFASFAGNSGDTLKTVDLNEVEIVSVRAGEKTPVTHSGLNRQTIEANNFGRDIPYILSLTPSVITTSDAGTGIGYTGFRIRGIDANRINITANGVPLNDSESHGVFWVNMPDFASSLEDMQIQRGVGTSTNGAGAFGASINMRTSYIPLESYSEFNGSYGSFNTQKATLKIGSGKIGEHFALDGRISSITSDGFIDRASVDLKSYLAQGAYFSDKTAVKFITFGGKERTYHAWDGVPQEILDNIFIPDNRTYNPSGYMGDDADGNAMYYKNATDNYRQNHYQLSIHQQFSDKIKLNAALHYTKGAGYYEEYKQNRTLEEYRLPDFVDAGETFKKSDLVRQKHLDNDFYGGVFSLDYKQDRWNITLGGGANNYEGAHFGKVIWAKTEDYINHEYYRSDGKKFDANLYFKGDYSLTEHLNLYGDLQYRRINYMIDGTNDVWDWQNSIMQKLNIDEHFNFFNPKAGVFCQIDNINQIYGSVAVAHREPNRDNYTENITEKPVAERLTDYELGYRFTEKNFAAGANIYYMKYKNQLTLNGKTNEIGEPLTSNVPASYRAGIELTADIKITPDLHWNGNLTLSENRIKNYTEYVTVDDGYSPQETEFYANTPTAYSPAVIAGSVLGWKRSAFTVALQSQYVGKQYIDNTGHDDRTINSYFVNNLRLGYDFKLRGTKELSVNLIIYNLFNEQYENNGYIYYASYYSNSGGNRDFYIDKRYFPQAGTNFMINAGAKF
ncbi:MAG: TonB-dependent receptor [Dysgonamonadaceae bacterium]|jgi:iron complex outermembrane receptor protein|nr:TonB-dependent receptor [Dysgonamonadaceae bacterium]